MLSKYENKSHNIFFIIATTITQYCAQAIVGLQINVNNTNIVLSWPSTSGEIYIVQYRQSLLPETPWMTLTNSLPAQTGTNWTTFIHYGAVEYPTNSFIEGDSSGSLPMVPNSLKNIGEYNMLSDDFEKNMETKIELPPVPWDPSTWCSPSGPIILANELSSTSNKSSGFYRVFIPSPIAKDDVFGVEQGSVTNQLNILENDNDPDDNIFLLSNVTPAANGEIMYFDNASILWYSPTSSFYGMDSFTYEITNDVGGRAEANVIVFVNQNGNHNPSASLLEFILATNETGLSFSALTNATDPDGDNLFVAKVFVPKRGSAITNAEGIISYTRTSDYLARDEFEYVITDNRGGFVRRTVIILPMDADDDGMPDEWEIQNNLNPSINDALDDPDADGLPNIAEYKLATSPWVSDNPLNLDNTATNQTFHDYALIPIPLKNHINKQPIFLLINSNRANASFTRRSDGGWYITWDTGYLTNGNYLICLEFEYQNYTDAGNSPFVGNSKPIVVKNDIMFNQLTSEFTDNFVFDVNLSTLTNYWRIELFNEQNQYLGYFYGFTTNGSIQGVWDLTDGQGNQLAYSHVRADFYISEKDENPPGGTSRKSSRWFIKEVGGVGDTFVLAWGWNNDDNFKFANDRNTLMLNGVINILANPSRNDAYFLRPAANCYAVGSFRYNDEIDKEILINAIKASDSGNFFWFGHGNGDTIYGNCNRSSIISDEVEEALQNKKHRSSNKIARGNKHPYRLVIMNGCETYSRDWANAFGIDYSEGGTTNDVYAYYRQGRQSRAFVGWKTSISVPRPGNPSFFSDYYAMGLAALFSGWMDGYTLETCLTWYAYYMKNYGFSGHDSWKISGTAYLWRTAP